MNEENRKFIWKNIQKTGDYLFDKLPDHPNHPNGRNPFAHVALKVKTKFGLKIPIRKKILSKLNVLRMKL